MTHWLQRWRLLLLTALISALSACLPASSEPIGSGFDASLDTGRAPGGVTSDGAGAADDAGPTDDGAGADDIGPADAADDDAQEVHADPLWPPAIVEESESFEVGSKGGTFELLGREFVLTVPAGTFPDGTKQTVERTIITLGDDSLVGYIWGPHGDAVDPPATVEVTVPAGWVPPFDAGVTDVGLYSVAADGSLVALGESDLRVSGDDLVLSGEVRALGRIVIAGPGDH